MASFAIFSRTLLTTRTESSYGIFCHLQPSSCNYSAGILTRNCLICTANRHLTGNTWSLLWTTSFSNTLQLLENSYGILCHLQPSSSNYSAAILIRNCLTGTANRHLTGNTWSLLWITSFSNTLQILENSYDILCHLQPSSSNYSAGILTRNCLTGTANRQPSTLGKGCHKSWLQQLEPGSSEEEKRLSCCEL
jgi:hypothetical protein